MQECVILEINSILRMVTDTQTHAYMDSPQRCFAIKTDHKDHNFVDLLVLAKFFFPQTIGLHFILFEFYQPLYLLMSIFLHLFQTNLDFHMFLLKW